MCDSPALHLVDNIRYKMIEGAMINTQKVDYISFAHGTFQFIENKKDCCVWFISKKDNELHETAVKMLDLSKSNIHVTKYNGLELPL